MRIHIKTTPSAEFIDFNHLHFLTGVLHKWFGRNDFHDTMSLYSFSNLQGGKAFKQKGLKFEQGASFFISCWQEEDVKRLVEGIQASPRMFGGLEVQELALQKPPDLSEQSYFYLGSPVYIQRTLEDGKKKFYFYDDKEANDLLKATLENKMKKVGLPIDETLRIAFDTNYAKKKVKKLDYHGKNVVSQIKANWCPVRIEGKAATKQFAWCVGLGNSTGIGFGALK